MRCVSEVEYELDLPNELASVHPVFHVSMLKKCVGDPTTIVEKVTVDILDWQVQKLRRRKLPL